jgi:hypothetical protein
MACSMQQAARFDDLREDRGTRVSIARNSMPAQSNRPVYQARIALRRRADLHRGHPQADGCAQFKLARLFMLRSRDDAGERAYRAIVEAFKYANRLIEVG